MVAKKLPVDDKIAHNQLSRNILLFSCNPIGHLSPGDPVTIAAL